MNDQSAQQSGSRHPKKPEMQSAHKQTQENDIGKL